jgi:hypothetical protein
VLFGLREGSFARLHFAEFLIIFASAAVVRYCYEEGGPMVFVMRDEQPGFATARVQETKSQVYILQYLGTMQTVVSRNKKPIRYCRPIGH